MAEADALSPASSPASWQILSTLDTTKHSVLHRVMAAAGGGRPRPVLAYLVAIAVTYLPLALAALFSLPSVHQRYESVTLPFLFDWNVLFMFTVSIPSVIAFAVSDNDLLVTSISRIVRDEIVVVPEQEAAALRDRWTRLYARGNVAGQLIGFAVGGTVAWFNYAVLSVPSVGYWISSHGRLTVAGGVYLYCIFVYYLVIPIYVARCLITAAFLRDLVTRSTVHLVPFHPDRCGGLRPVGTLGLRNQYLLSILGLNLVILIYVAQHSLNIPIGLTALILVAAVAYLTFGPLVFLAPLIPFRSGMMRNKNELMREVAQRLRAELGRIRANLKSGPVTQADADLVQRLRSIGNLIEELPVWPFDARTLRKFLTAYVLPLLGTIGVPLLQWLGGLVMRKG